MSKVICAAIECKHNENSICKKKEINLTSGNIATVHEGRQDVWWCKMFEMSDFSKDVVDIIRKESPKKVVMHGFDPNKPISTVHYTCPTCTAHISRVNRCPHCHQVLDWSSIE